jgi:hypothetical protein
MHLRVAFFNIFLGRTHRVARHWRASPVPNISSVLRYTAPCTELDFILLYTVAKK